MAKEETVVLGFRVPRRWAFWARAAADEQGRGLSEYLRETTEQRVRRDLKLNRNREEGR